MVSAEELLIWKEYGGRVEERSRSDSGRVDRYYFTSKGEKLRSWKECEDHISSNPDGRKKKKDSPAGVHVAKKAKAGGEEAVVVESPAKKSFQTPGPQSPVLTGKSPSNKKESGELKKKLFQNGKSPSSGGKGSDRKTASRVGVSWSPLRAEKSPSRRLSGDSKQLFPNGKEKPSSGKDCDEKSSPSKLEISSSNPLSGKIPKQRLSTALSTQNGKSPSTGKIANGKSLKGTDAEGPGVSNGKELKNHSQLCDSRRKSPRTKQVDANASVVDDTDERTENEKKTPNKKQVEKAANNEDHNNVIVPTINLEEDSDFETGTSVAGKKEMVGKNKTSKQSPHGNGIGLADQSTGHPHSAGKKRGRLSEPKSGKEPARKRGRNSSGGCVVGEEDGKGDVKDIGDGNSVGDDGDKRGDSQGEDDSVDVQGKTRSSVKASNVDAAKNTIPKRSKSGPIRLKQQGGKKSDAAAGAGEKKPGKTDEKIKCGVPRPRRSSVAVSYTEKNVHFDESDAHLKITKDKVVDSEDILLVMTERPPAHGVGDDDDRGNAAPQRRLADFIVHDEDGKHMPIESMHEVSLYLTGTVFPVHGAVDKGQGVRCEGFGPLNEWSMSGFESAGNQEGAFLWLSTEAADYRCLKPSPNYRKIYNILFEKAVLCVEFYRLLCPAEGGNPDLHLDDAIARVSRVTSGGKNRGNARGFSFGRDSIFRHGKFVVDQLSNLDQVADESDSHFTGLPCLKALEEEVVHRETMLRRINSCSNAPLRIGEAAGSAATGTCSSSSEGKGSDQVTSDAMLARILQEQEEKDHGGKGGPRRGRAMPGSKSKVYIKINEDEIASDYPLPTFYKPVDEEEEVDEYLLFDEDVENLLPADLPRRRLEDWALYNADARLMPLEVLPMMAGVETDMDIYGSGFMMDDDGSVDWVEQIGSGCESPGAESSTPKKGGNAGAGASSAGMAGGSTPFKSPGGGKGHGMRVYLSAIKEWMIEFGAGMLFISIRTDGAWYRLGRPSKQYAPWYAPVLKVARLAIKAITMLKAESRASKLSFTDVVRRLAEQEATESTFVSSKTATVERYVVVHGQIILNQFREYPDESIRRCAFVSGLTMQMEMRHHTKLKLLLKKKVIGRSQGTNQNPMAHKRPDTARQKPMRATTTKLVHHVWSSYYEKLLAEEGGDNDVAGGEGESGGNVKSAVKDAVDNVIEVEDEVIEIEDKDSEDEEEDNDFVEETQGKKGQNGRVVKKNSAPKRGSVEWVGSGKKGCKGETLYGKARVNGNLVVRGEAIAVPDEDVSEDVGSSREATFLLVQRLYQNYEGEKMAHGRVLEKAVDTVLGNAGNERELFMTDRCLEIALAAIEGSISIEIRKREWGFAHRETAEEAAKDRESAEKRKKEGLPVEYILRSVYAPLKGAFFELPKDLLGSDNGSTCPACAVKQAEKELNETRVLTNLEGFRFEGVEYNINDCLYVASGHVDNGPNSEKDRGPITTFKGGRNVGASAFVVCQLMKVNGGQDKASVGGKKGQVPIKVTVRRFFRPEDVSAERAYKADLHEVYFSEKLCTVDVSAVMGKCSVRRPHEVFETSASRVPDNTFVCSLIYDPSNGSIKQLPPVTRLGPSSPRRESLRGADKGKGKVEEAIKAAAKGKKKIVENADQCRSPSSKTDDERLATLDIFAGCGGLSEGLEQSGASRTKWAIEYERPAADAFKLNHPEAEVFCENCNVILRCMMERGGNLSDCLSTPEADEQAKKMDEDKLKKLPLPGEVDFINGGPPCQGFSGMNRFNQRTWSKVQCEMILAFLSYADFFRPRYFLLENVRNFVSFNKGQTFRLTLRSLLEMGYQVRFGVLQAGNYGVSQSRKRAFIWAAAPGEILPEWPQPEHVFLSSQLKITLPGGLQYSAVKDGSLGAPLRSITVKDTIGDLPPIVNGADKAEIAYGKMPESWFQRGIRRSATVLRDHICKEMNELNYIRCQRIPKRPGADWRDLPEEKINLSNGQVVDLIPWCLPNTASRHNQWKGLYGRLDWEGNFPTSVTDPQPMGKVGMCFHPEQDRIVTVRECARSQGFPDTFSFSGTIQAKHRQIGNAVPPPLACALGRKLKEAVLAKELQEDGGRG